MTKVNRVRRPNHWGRSSRREVICSRYWWIQTKASPRRAWNRSAPTCPAELTRPVIPKQADGFTCYRVPGRRPRRSASSLFGASGKNVTPLNPNWASSASRAAVGAGEFLVVVVEVGFQPVDGFQSHRDPAGVDLRRAAGAPRQGVHQGGGVRFELHRVPVGLRSLPREVRVPDDERPAQHRVTHCPHPQKRNDPTRG